MSKPCNEFVKKQAVPLNDKVCWQVCVGITALLILTLVLLWPDKNDRNPHGNVSPVTDSSLPPPARAPDHAAGKPNNPFASNGPDPMAGVQTESSATPDPGTIPVPTTSASTHVDSATDWGKWPKADERQYGYLGGPPGPGKPAE